MSMVNTLVVPSAIFLVLEGVYFFVNKTYLSKVFDKSDSCFDPNNVKTVGLVVYFLIQLFALIYFLILGFASVLNSFIFGFVLSGSAVACNYAHIKDYNLNSGAVSVLVTSTIFALTVYLSRML
jgi:hypothetical protein